MTSEERQAVEKILQGLTTFPVIVELGGHCGEDGPVFESMLGGTAKSEPKFLHVMVEPDSRNYQVIESNRGRPLGPFRRLIKGAIADTSGVRIFHFSYDSRDGSRGSGSIMQPTGHLKHFPTISFTKTAIVECYTLDELFVRQNLGHIDLLWVDIQGAEAQMIAGGQHALSLTRYCFMEAEEVELYAGQALKADLIKLLPGWRLIQDFGYNILLENTRFKQ